MKLLNAFGLSFFLAVFGLLMPAVFAELARTLIVFLRASQDAFIAAGTLASYAGSIH